MRPYHVEHTYSSLIPALVKPFIRPTFIETGTNLGLGIGVALQCGATKVYSVEEDAAMFARARDLYRLDPRVTLYCCDSPAFLRTVLTGLTTLGRDTDLTIYLDAHSLDRNPLLDELDVIESCTVNTPIILIDDVRMFGTADWHGLMKEEAIERLQRIQGDYTFDYLDTNHGGGDLLVAYLA